MSELASPKPKKLLDQPRDAIRNKHYSYSAEKTYVHWAKRYILFHNKRHPNKMGGSEIELFLTYLAATKKVCPSTQNQALSVLLFLYREVLDLPLDLTFQSVQARRSHHLSTVLSKTEVERVLSQLSVETLLMSQLLYGYSLRLMECLRLQIHVPELYYRSTDLNISSPTFRFSGEPLCGTYAATGCYAISIQPCNWDNLNFTISMTSALGMGLFNGNWMEPLANL